ncbi:DUF1516 family protein [Salibacterium halotolerans]|uniref:Uncharacterized protein n=1 Tax=Salibacterium halotolerans TaxID=1884432 RepID=A0A1I5TU79_9BACI|nr:DUF1516 family protein [Salibacterium halotolerans]SFP86593.1 Protein of unknown function [Salibacterium halotolerans]
MFDMLQATHEGSWFLLVIFFFISYFVPKQKITLMIMRLFAVIMLISGIGMLLSLGFPLLYIFKGVLALIAIALMEITIAGKKRGEARAGMTGLLVILLILIVLIGYGVI